MYACMYAQLCLERKTALFEEYRRFKLVTPMRVVSSSKSVQDKFGGGRKEEGDLCSFFFFFCLKCKYFLWTNFMSLKKETTSAKPKSTNWRIVIPHLQQYKSATPEQLLQLKYQVLQRIKSKQTKELLLFFSRVLKIFSF